MSTEEAFHHLTDQISSIKVNKSNCTVIQSDIAVKVNSLIFFYFFLVYFQHIELFVIVDSVINKLFGAVVKRSNEEEFRDID